METIREKAKKFFRTLFENDKRDSFIDYDKAGLDVISEAMIEFANIYAFDKCEEQKKVCAEVADSQIIYDDDDFLGGIGCSINYEEILNTPNVCQK